MQQSVLEHCLVNTLVPIIFCVTVCIKFVLTHAEVNRIAMMKITTIGEGILFIINHNQLCGMEVL